MTNFERQVRDLRSQLSMKNKDIANYREEVQDLEGRLTAKTNELRTTKTQMQVIQSRYEDAMREMDQFQFKNVRASQEQPDQQLMAQLDTLR